jgi:hypothetical protein
VPVEADEGELRVRPRRGERLMEARRRLMADPRLRQVSERPADGAAESWWVGKGRAEFSSASETRAAELRAAQTSVKTPLNFVG